MKAAFSTWDDRIAPVFDVARQIDLVDTENGTPACRASESFADDIPINRAVRLSELGVDTLVCGAISRPLQIQIAAHGIRVVPFVTGDLQEIIQAWIDGVLQDGPFAMPGCCGRAGREGFEMNGRRQGGRGSCGGQGRGGQGQGGGCGGRRGGSSPGADCGTCVCTKCDYREPHQPGVPCYGKNCPQCGSPMTRE